MLIVVRREIPGVILSTHDNSQEPDILTKYHAAEFEIFSTSAEVFPFGPVPDDIELVR